MALQAKATNTWEQALHHGFIPCLLALNHVIWSSLWYLLAVTSFLMSQALSATSKLYCTLLPWLGTNRFYPLALRHAPVKFHGLGLPHPFWEQGIAALKLFLEFGNTLRPEQSLLHTSLECLQLEVGIGSPIFLADFSQWGYIATDCWVKHLWSFLHLASIQLLLATSWVPPVQWQNDAFIMDWDALLHLLAHDLAVFNHCHLVHKVLFLSDIMDGRGHSLHDSLLLPPVPSPSSTWHWPCAATVLGNWTWSPHLQVFIPFDPTSNTTYILCSS